MKAKRKAELKALREKAATASGLLTEILDEIRGVEGELDQELADLPDTDSPTKRRKEEKLENQLGEYYEHIRSLEETVDILEIIDRIVVK